MNDPVEIVIGPRPAEWFILITPSTLEGSMVTVAPAGGAIRFTRPSTAVNSPADISIPSATKEIAFPSGTASAPPSNRITDRRPPAFQNPNAPGPAAVQTP